ncbi:uncharacterized protein LOC141834299 isoform X2 [Curcuma longa]|uniref:uncharacterized protein LOC141834299 isoform X2 n=1 Tax=Curcuma longa TaxID=136217 RepID=UPI003D9F41B1
MLFDITIFILLIKIVCYFQLPPNSNYVRVAVCSALSDLFTRLSLFSNLREDGITFVAKLMPPIMELLNENESVDVLEGDLTLLTTILKSFPLSYVLYDKVERALVGLLVSRIYAEDLLKKIANCLAVLPMARVDENSQSLMMQKIILEINILLNDYFQGLEGVVDLLSLGRDTPSQLGIVFLLSKITKEPTSKFVLYVIPTIMILMQCCGMMLTNSYPVQESVPLSALVALVRRVLSLNHSFHISLTGFTASTTFDEDFLRMRLPALHSGCMDLLIAVIEGVRSQFKAHADTVAQMLIEYSKRGLLTHLKIKWYSVMKSLLSIMGDGIVLLLAEELMNNASADLNGGSTHTESSSRHTESSIHLSVKIAALEALKTLLTAGKSLKSQFWRLDMDHFLITIAKNAFNMGWSDDFKLAALDTLYASLDTLELRSHRPPHFGELLDLFRTGQQEIGTKTADFCDDKLMFLQRFISLGLFPFD